MLCRLFSAARRRHCPRRLMPALDERLQGHVLAPRSAAERRHWPSTGAARRLRRPGAPPLLRAVAGLGFHVLNACRALVLEAPYKSLAWRARSGGARRVFPRRQACAARARRHRRSTMKQKDAPLRRALRPSSYDAPRPPLAAAAAPWSSASSSSWAHRTASRASPPAPGVVVVALRCI